MVKTINVKNNNSSPDYAVYVTDSEINDSKKTDTNILVIIHGYGSKGRGGTMKQEIHNYLLQAKNHRKIIDYYKGEQWSATNEDMQQLCSLYPELILHSQIQNYNSGVTIVWVSK